MCWIFQINFGGKLYKLITVIHLLAALLWKLVSIVGLVTLLYFSRQLENGKSVKWHLARSTNCWSQLEHNWSTWNMSWPSRSDQIYQLKVHLLLHAQQADVFQKPELNLKSDHSNVFYVGFHYSWSGLSQFLGKYMVIRATSRWIRDKSQMVLSRRAGKDNWTSSEIFTFRRMWTYFELHVCIRSISQTCTNFAHFSDISNVNWSSQPRYFYLTAA